MNERRWWIEEDARPEEPAAESTPAPAAPPQRSQHELYAGTRAELRRKLLLSGKNRSRDLEKALVRATAEMLKLELAERRRS